MPDQNILPTYQWRGTWRCALTITLALAMFVAGLQVSVAQGDHLMGKKGGLYLKEGQLPVGSAVTGIEIHLYGTFNGVENVPPDWHCEIDNDLSGPAVLRLSAKLGVIGLREAALLDIGLQVTELPHADERSQVWGWLTLAAKDGKERKVPIDYVGLMFVESYLHRRP